MENSAISVAAMAGIFVPIIVSLISTSKTSSAMKGWAALSISLVTGFAIVLARGDLVGVEWTADPALLVSSVVKIIGIVAVSAQTSYNMFIKPSGLAQYFQMNVGITEELDDFEEGDPSIEEVTEEIVE